MEYVRLGSTGMKVSRLCLGCMWFGDATRWTHKWVLNATAETDQRSKIAHLEEAISALSVKLTREEVAYLEEPYAPHRIVGHQ